MKAFVCVDKKNGLLFNRRRVSQDRVVREKIIELCDETPLWMSQYSAGQFEEYPRTMVIDADYWDKAAPEDFCFVEDTILWPVEKIDSLYVFNWNRQYPSDVQFPLELFLKAGFRPRRELEFAGSSHKEITLTIYERD